MCGALQGIPSDAHRVNVHFAGLKLRITKLTGGHFTADIETLPSFLENAAVAIGFKLCSLDESSFGKPSNFPSFLSPGFLPWNRATRD